MRRFFAICFRELEYFYLLASLIEGIPYVSNITGTYGAYLKQWDKRAFKEFEMIRLNIVNNNKKNKVYNKDSNQLINEIEGDILYLDPPYNNRQYAPNYHLLETISMYDNPKITGVTGMRPYKEQKSLFCIKSEVLPVFEDLVAKAKFENIIMSYSSDGLMTSEQIEMILKKYGIENSFQRYDLPYRKYKSKLTQEEKVLNEYIFYVKKHIARPKYFTFLKSDCELVDILIPKLVAKSDGRERLLSALKISPLEIKYSDLVGTSFLPRNSARCNGIIQATVRGQVRDFIAA